MSFSLPCFLPLQPTLLSGRCSVELGSPRYPAINLPPYLHSDVLPSIPWSYHGQMARLGPSGLSLPFVRHSSFAIAPALRTIAGPRSLNSRAERNCGGGSRSHERGQSSSPRPSNYLFLFLIVTILAFCPHLLILPGNNSVGARLGYYCTPITCVCLCVCRASASTTVHRLPTALCIAGFAWPGK